MLGQALFSWFGTSNTQSWKENVQPTWDPKTLTMTQPSSPAAPTTDTVVTNQPRPTEDMQLQLRGGGGGPEDDCCCCCCFCCGDCCGPDGPPGGPEGPGGGPGGPPGGGPGGW